MRKKLSPNKAILILIVVAIFQLNNDIHHVNSRFHKKIKYMTEQLNAFGVCYNTCFRRIRQVINLLKSATSYKNNENDNKNYYYYYSIKITKTRCRI